MSAPRIVAVVPDSPAAVAGLTVGDLVTSVNDVVPRDVLEWQQLVDSPVVELSIERGGLEQTVVITKDHQPLGVEVDSALFDRVRTCDNHCDFCFIYQLPKGMRRSLYLKDDDYRLSFLYGNFTTLTRFTESDLERVITEGLSPLYVSIHATDPDVRSHMLRNRRGAMSLRWLRALLDHGIDVHGQVVVCPGVNNGAVLEDTLAGIADDYSELQTVAVVPLGISDHAPNNGLRVHTEAEAAAVIDIVERWQHIFLDLFGSRKVFAADEYYLLAGRKFPEAATYEGFALHEDGVGMARTFEAEFHGEIDDPTNPAAGFFAWVEGAPAEGYRAPRNESSVATAVELSPRREVSERTFVLSGVLGAAVIAPLVAELDRDDVEIVPVPNRFFGGNVGVTGLMVGADIEHVLQTLGPGRVIVPDVCLSNGVFLDDVRVDELSRPVDVIATNGIALRQALGAGRVAATATKESSHV